MSTPAPSLPSAELADARALYRQRDWPALAERLRPLPEEALLAEPELGFLFADVSFRLGETEACLRVLWEVEPLALRSGDRRLVVNVVNLLGIALFATGRMEEAEARFEELLEKAADWDDVDFAARAANGLGTIANVRGRRDLAIAHYQRAIAGYTRIGNTRGLAQTHYNLGLSFRDLHFDDDADAHYRRAMALAEASESEDVVALAETERAVLQLRRGDGKLAASLAARAGERLRRLGDPPGYAQTVRVRAGACRAQGDEDSASALLEEALEIALAHPEPLLRAEVQRDRGLLLRDRGAHAAAREALDDAAAQFEGIGAAAEAEAVRVILSSLADDG